LVNPSTGVVEESLLSVASPHGLDFVPSAVGVPEPSTWALLRGGARDERVSPQARAAASYQPINRKALNAGLAKLLPVGLT